MSEVEYDSGEIDESWSDLRASTAANLDQDWDAVTSLLCSRRLNIDPPCRSKFDPGRAAAF